MRNGLTFVRPVVPTPPMIKYILIGSAATSLSFFLLPNIYLLHLSYTTSLSYVNGRVRQGQSYPLTHATVEHLHKTMRQLH